MQNLNSNPLKLRVKYCGGCNPVIDRKKVVDETLNCLKESIQIELTRDYADAALVICGCSAACVDIDEIIERVGFLILVAGETVNHYPVPRNQIASRVCELILEAVDFH